MVFIRSQTTGLKAYGLDYSVYNMVFIHLRATDNQDENLQSWLRSMQHGLYPFTGKRQPGWKLTVLTSECICHIHIRSRTTRLEAYSLDYSVKLIVLTTALTPRSLFSDRHQGWTLCRVVLDPSREVRPPALRLRSKLVSPAMKDWNYVSQLYPMRSPYVDPRMQVTRTTIYTGNVILPPTYLKTVFNTMTEPIADSSHPPYLLHVF